MIHDTITAAAAADVILSLSVLYGSQVIAFLSDSGVRKKANF